MTVDELIQELKRFPGHFRVIFSPGELMTGGIPVWADARCRQGEGHDPDDNVVLQDRVIVELDGEL